MRTGFTGHEKQGEKNTGSLFYSRYFFRRFAIIPFVYISLRFQFLPYKYILFRFPERGVFHFFIFYIFSMFQKGDKNITGDVKIDGKTDRLEDVLDPFRCTPLGESQNFRSARDHVHAGRRCFPVGQAEIIETVVSLCRAAQCMPEIKDTALTFVFGIDSTPSVP